MTKYLILALMMCGLSAFSQNDVVKVDSLYSCDYFTSADELKKKIKNYFLYSDFEYVMMDDWDVLKFKKIQNATFEYCLIDRSKKKPSELYKSFLLDYSVLITVSGGIEKEETSFDMVVVSTPVGQKIPSAYRLRKGEGLNYDAFFRYLYELFELNCP